MSDSSEEEEEGLDRLIKMAGTMLIASAIPVGAGVAVRRIAWDGGERAIVLCFSIIVAMSALRFILIWAGGKFAKRNRRKRGNSKSS